MGTITSAAKGTPAGSRKLVEKRRRIPIIPYKQTTDTYGLSTEIRRGNPSRGYLFFERGTLLFSDATIRFRANSVLSMSPGLSEPE